MQLWSAHIAQQEIMALALYMMALLSAVSALHASWRIRPIAEDE